MSTKSEMVWVIVVEMEVIDGSHAALKHDCIAKFAARGIRSWEDLYSIGFRCVRATLTWEEPDERED